MVYFSNFGKTVKDLFKKDKYELNRTISVKCTSEDTEWTTECSFPASAEEKSSAKAIYKYSDKSYGTVKVEVPNVKPKKLDYQTPSLMDGLKVNFLVEHPDKKSGKESQGQMDCSKCCDCKFSLKAEYEQERVMGKVCAEMGQTDSVKAELAAEVKGFWLGGEVKYEVGGGLKEYSTGVHCKMGDTQFDAKTNFEKFNIKMHKEYCSTGELAAEYDLDLQSRTPEVSVGGRWKLDDKCGVQGYVSSGGNTYMLYNHKLSDRLTASLGTSFDIANLQQDKVSVHYKFEMEA